MRAAVYPFTSNPLYTQEESLALQAMSLITSPVVALAQNRAVATSYTVDDLWADLGGQAEEKAFERRVQALTAPGAYQAARAQAMTAARGAVSASFRSAYAGYIAAGISPDQAKALARQAAHNEYALQRGVVAAQFPGTDELYALGANRAAGLPMSLPGMSAAAAPAAPARRAPARRAPAPARKPRKPRKKKAQK